MRAPLPLKKLLFVLLACLTWLHALETGENLDLPFSPSKFVYIKNITPKKSLEKTIYIGQKIKITYNLLLLSDARLVGVSFDTPINPRALKLVNEEDITWELQPDGSYQADYVYKILSKSATLPQLKATAISQNQKYQDIAISPKITLDIYNLKSNPKYSNLIGDNLLITSSKTKKYDETSNILILELESQNANLEDFNIPNPDIIKQGFQSLEDGRGTYYCIFPRSYSRLAFDFFSLPKNQFETLTIPIVISQDDTAAQDDLKPKNIFLLYSTLFLIALIMLSIAVYVFLWRKKFILIITLALFAYLLWHIFYRNDIILQSNQVVKILPTHNSTTLFVVTSPMEAEIIGKHQKFYKIITPDGKIGWIEKRPSK